MSLGDELDDLVDQWHEGEWPGKSLEDVIRLRTGWSHEQFDRWVTGGVRAATR